MAVCSSNCNVLSYGTLYAVYEDWSGVLHTMCNIILVIVIACQCHRISNLDQINDFLIFGLTAISRKLAKNEKKEKEPEKPEENGSDI